MRKNIKNIHDKILAFFKNDKRNIIGVVIAVIAGIAVASLMTENTSDINTNVRPDTPKIVKNVTGDGYAAIEWQPCSGAFRYAIQMKKKGVWKTILVRKGQDNVFQQIYRTGRRRKARVRVIAISRSGEKSLPSKAVRIRANLDIPAVISLKKRYMVWMEVSGAKRYEVSVKRHGKWKVLTTTRDTIYYHNFAKKLLYRVRAIGTRGETSKYDTISRRNMNYGKINAIIEGDSHMSPIYSWSLRSTMVMGMNVTNRAVSGATMAGSGNSVLKRSERYGFKGADLIIIRAGSNDYNQDVRMGTVTSNVATYYGAYKRVLTIARRDAPNARIVIVTPTEKRAYKANRTVYAYSAHNRRGQTLEDYRDADYRLAEQFDCYIYDMKNNKYLNKTSVETATYDLKHPTIRTHIEISREFTKFLKNTVLQGKGKGPKENKVQYASK